MPFTVRETRSYPQDKATVYQAALAAVAGLEGKIKAQDAGRGAIEAQFHKTILGKVLGDRTHLSVAIRPGAEGETTVAVEVYPLDAIGRKLQFGARKGVPQTVMNWFFAHLEHHLGANKG